MISDFFNLEEKKILLETIRKILYGLSFEELPPVKILQSIEEDNEVILEFKNHFRFLVPQVYGWEFMDDYMYNHKLFPCEVKRTPQQRDECIRVRYSFQPKNKCITYYQLYRKISDTGYDSNFEKTGENFWKYNYGMKKASLLGEDLFYSLWGLNERIKGEEKYLEEQSKRSAVYNELYSQLEKYLGDYDTIDKKMHYGILSDEFVDDLINNKLIKCENTLSGDDSGLGNFWEEYCVQVQQEHSFFWQTYLDQIDFWTKEEFEKLPIWQRNAIWLDLKHKDIWDYFDAEYDPDESEDKGDFFNEDDAKNVDIEKKRYYYLNEVNDLINQRVTDKAADFTNKAIERYLHGDCYSYFDDSDDEDD